MHVMTQLFCPFIGEVVVVYFVNVLVYSNSEEVRLYHLAHIFNLFCRKHFCINLK